jgi:V/A-type H+/Na+-transporting ATPase subunit I
VLKPVPMSRVLLVGPRDELEETINKLYDLKLIHIVDHKAGEEGLELGKPLPSASEASEVLVKLRSVSSILNVTEKPTVKSPIDLKEAREEATTLETSISEADTERKKIQSQLSDLSAKISELTPFAELPLTLADYRGYQSLTVLVGKTSKEITGLDSITTEYETYYAPGILAVFVANQYADKMREYLNQRGFSSLTVPEGETSPKEILVQLLAKKESHEKRLTEIEANLSSLREKYATFLTSAKAHLEIEVEKAEAPLRFAVTDHTFIVEGWVPKESFPELKKQVEQLPDLFADEVEVDAHGSEPPTLLRNIKVFRPFEMMVNLFGVPAYHEIDPTFVMAIVFPILFGLMIGDAGYGVAWLLFGAYILRKWAREPGDFRNLVIAIMWGGFWSFIFGLFVFAEAFGVPFHASTGPVTTPQQFANQFSWSYMLGFTVPIYAQLEKLTDVKDFIVISIVAAYIHLGIGYIIGIVDELGHSKKHVITKVAWFFVLTSIFLVIMVRTSRLRTGQFVWNVVFGWFPRVGFAYPSIGFTAQNPIPYAAVGIGLIGAAIIGASEGIQALEIFGLLANVISYARLAGVGVAKAAMAFALNTIVLQNFIFPWAIEGGSFLYLIIGLVVAVVAQLLLFFLGAISASIQAIRLNYVEFFLKFYRGVGGLFRPFGAKS